MTLNSVFVDREKVSLRLASRRWIVSRPMRALVGGLFTLVMGLTLYAQDVSQNFISAKSGMVNYVEGKPIVFTSDNQQGSKVSARDQLKSGDRLQTEENDRVEILLNPGSYLRVAANSEVQILQTSFDDMHFGMTRGVAILESAAFDKKAHSIKISTPSGDLQILANGLYRFKVSPDRPVEVSVYSGKVKWLKDQREVGTLKSGKRYGLGAAGEGKLQTAKLDKQSLDSLDLWSKKRAELLVAVNDRISPSLLDYPFYDYSYSSRGMWIYNPFFQMFTFLPFGYGFLSPYGFAYNYYYYPVYGYGGYYNQGAGGSGKGSSAPTQAGTGKASGSRSGNTSTAVHRPSASTSSSSPSPRVSSGRSDVGNSPGGRGTVRQR